ncbi:probable ATP-dependent RNA helicase DHX35, partial [Ostrinia furnacalis]|uniref:probable ATP-dependent RNA helicase DHX35 n=1 Tax=Ostrinia furnacalis TaxID=93504 RepID=UPI00103A78AC
MDRTARGKCYRLVAREGERPGTTPRNGQYYKREVLQVHERSQMTDVLMGLLKKIAKKRKNLKLVVSSATMDAEFLRDFFNVRDKKDSERGSSSVIMSMQGRTHPIDVYYSAEPVADYVKATVDTVIKIHENEPFGDVLAFLTSQEEILEALDTLRTYAEENNQKNKHRRHFPSGVQAANLNVVPMYGSLPHYKQIQAFQIGDKNVRKVVLATNIAETSVTIPGIVYVRPTRGRHPSRAAHSLAEPLAALVCYTARQRHGGCYPRLRHAYFVADLVEILEEK